MLALAGEGSWLDVAVDLFAVVTFGFGAKAGLALRAEEVAGSTTRVGSDIPRGARGPASGRPFDPEAAGGPVRNLNYQQVKINDRGVDAVEKHLSRFPPDAGPLDSSEQKMVTLLRSIAKGDLKPTDYDQRF